MEKATANKTFPKSLRRDRRDADGDDDGNDPRTSESFDVLTVDTPTASLDVYPIRRGSTVSQLDNKNRKMGNQLPELASPLTANFQGRASAYVSELGSDANRLMLDHGVLDLENFTNGFDDQAGSEDGDGVFHGSEDLTPVMLPRVGTFQSASGEASSPGRLEGHIHTGIGPHRQRTSARVASSDPYYVPDNNRNAAARYRGSVKKGFDSLKRSLIERGTLPESQADSFSRSQILKLAALTLSPPRDMC